jgi:hypothetical protein
MSQISVDELLRYASGLENERLTTAGGRASFSMKIVPQGIEITPDSSREPHIDDRETIQLVLDEYERSRNLQPGQYQEITADASYLLAIIARYHLDHRAA